MVHSWTFTGPHIPRPEQPRVHMNLWQIGSPSVDHEVIIHEFTFTPECSGPHCDELVSVNPQLTPATSFLSAPIPNPFSPSTSISYRVAQEARVTIVVFDVAGRAVKTLVSEIVPAGNHQVTWDGRDDSGNLVPSGVYIYQYRSGRSVESKRVVRLR